MSRQKSLSSCVRTKREGVPKETVQEEGSLHPPNEQSALGDWAERI